MFPILGRFGGGFIFSYTIVIVGGIFAGLYLTARLARNYAAPQWLEAWLFGLVGALIGGRIGFVFWRWDYFQQRPFQIYQFGRGGLSYWGGLVGGLVLLWLWSRWCKRPFLLYSKLFAPALVLLHATGWLACYLEGCGYGRATFIGLLAADLPDEFGIFAVRYQTQLIGFFLTLLLFALVGWLWRRGWNGRLFWIALFGLGCIQLTISLLRGDPFPQIGTWRLDTLLNAFLMIFSMVATLFHKPKPSFV